MKKFYFRNLFIGALFVTVLTSAIMSASGPGGGYSNAPGESSCSSCHGTGIITTGSNLNKLLLYGNFTGNGYIPDSTYTVTVSYKESGISKFGFQVTVLDANDAPIGTLTSSGSRNSKVTTNVNSQTRQYIQHTSTGTSSVATDSTNWSFSWKAPNANIGPVKFYVVVLAANGNSTNDAGDKVYGKTFSLSPSSLLPKAQPSVGNTTVCSNYSVQFNGSGTNSPTTYSWKFVGGSPTSSTSQNPTVSFTSAGTRYAILTVKNSKGTSFPDTITMNVLSSPSAVISNGASQTICQGDSLQLSPLSQTGWTYQWLHNNQTSRLIYVKDTGSYRVKVTNTNNSCTATSAAFRLNWYPKPVVSLSSNVGSDSFCQSYNVTFTASGQNIDSLHWYVNGVLTKRTKTLSASFSGNSNTNIYAVAKNVNGCLGDKSAIHALVVVPKIFPSSVTSNKTTSNINMKWVKTAGIQSVSYAINGGSYAATDGDTALHLSNLSPNTTYQITLRSKVGGPCGVTDTSFSIKTNACSNLQYTINYNNRVCKGSAVNVSISHLYKAKYSVSFNGSAYTRDTTYQLVPSASDSVRISIVDSLSPTCPAIEEALPYSVDLPLDTTTNTAKNVSICGTTYQASVLAGYGSYEFFLNNVSKGQQSGNTFNFTNLNDGDVITVKAVNHSCEKVYGPITLDVKPAANGAFAFTRDWKTYTFTANQSGNSTYRWRINGTLSGTSSSSLVSDFTSYNNSSVQMSLFTSNADGCSDSTSQTIQVPNFSSLNMLEDLGISIYPNPSSENFNVSSDNKEINVIRVHDAMGKLIAELFVSGTEQLIEATAWASGVYTLSIEMGNGLKVHSKLIKY